MCSCATVWGVCVWGYDVAYVLSKVGMAELLILKRLKRLGCAGVCDCVCGCALM